MERLSRVSDVSETPCFRDAGKPYVELVIDVRDVNSRLSVDSPSASTPRATSVFSESTGMAPLSGVVERPAPEPQLPQAITRRPPGMLA